VKSVILDMSGGSGMNLFSFTGGGLERSRVTTVAVLVSEVVLVVVLLVDVLLVDVLLVCVEDVVVFVGQLFVVGQVLEFVEHESLVELLDCSHFLRLHSRTHSS
jgi:hypothetical protein